MATSSYIEDLQKQNGRFYVRYICCKRGWITDGYTQDWLRVDIGSLNGYSYANVKCIHNNIFRWHHSVRVPKNYNKLLLTLDSRDFYRILCSSSSLKSYCKPGRWNRSCASTEKSQNRNRISERNESMLWKPKIRQLTRPTPNMGYDTSPCQGSWAFPSDKRS